MTPQQKRHVSIWASGSGSNAERIIRALREKHPTNTPVFSVLTNRKNAGVRERANKLECTCVYFSNSQLAEETEVLSYLNNEQVDLIVLAGFLALVPEKVVKSFVGRIVNIHPALLPKYGGKGMFGEHVHRAVHSNGERRSGITIHQVNELYDDGEVLLQATCKVFPEDTPEDIGKRVLKLEHRYYPEVVDQLLEGL